MSKYVNVSSTADDGEYITYNYKTNATISTITNSLDVKDDIYYPSDWEVFSYFTEKEIKELVDKLIQREKDIYKIKGFFSGILRVKHFSEGFICEYIDYINKDALYYQHDSDLKSGQYSRLKSLFEVEGN